MRKGQKLSIAHRAALSAAKKGKLPSTANRTAISAALTGRTLSVAHRTAISASVLKSWQLHERRVAHTVAMKGKNWKISEAKLAARRAANIEDRKRPEYRDRVKRTYKSAHRLAEIVHGRETCLLAGPGTECRGHIVMALRHDAPREQLHESKLTRMTKHGPRRFLFSMNPRHYIPLCVLHHNRYDKGKMYLLWIG